MMFFQGIGQKEQRVLEADRPGVRHPLDEKGAGYASGGSVVG